MRGSWIPVGSALIALFAFLPVGCGDSGETSPTGTTSSSTGTGGAGGSGGSTSTTMSGTGGSGGQAPTCMQPSDCPGVDSECGVRTCNGGVCGMDVLISDQPLPSQVYGDCKTVKCDDKGNKVTVDDAMDVYDDGNACTKDECMNGVPSNSPDMGMCGPPGAMCDMNGACVQCLADTDCGVITAPKCMTGKCVPEICANGAKDPVETDVDCGGPCLPCGATKACKAGTDCVSGQCLNKTCQPSTCSDGVKNGNETGVDCGGAECLSQGSSCDDGDGCKSPADCKSSVCKMGVCEAPSCTDGVKNAMETGVDCGGGCSPCP